MATAAAAEPEPRPSSVALLLDHLRAVPRPTELDIAILDDAGPYPARSYARVDRHLGIHAPDLPRLARDFRGAYASLRRRRRETTEGGVGEGEVEASSGFLDATACLLLVCPDHSTAWADRRRALLLDGGLAAAEDERGLREELEFCDLLFTQHSKA